MFSRARLVEVLTAEAAKGLVGNNINYIREAFAGAPAVFGYGNWAWCGAFVFWGCRQAGLDIPVLCPSKFGYSWALVEAWQQWAIQKGFYVVNDEKTAPQAGDIGIIDWGRRPFDKDTDWDDHVVLITGFENGMVQTAEGNTGAAPGHSGLFSRNLGNFEGFVRIPDGYSFSGGLTVVHPSVPTDVGFFDEAVARILLKEGGFVNHPNDKGGPTNWGITIATLATWRKTGVTEEDVRRLTQAEAKSIYFANYWTPMKLGLCHDRRLAMMMLDQGCNRGTIIPVKDLQGVLNKYFMKNLVIDGEFGPLSANAARESDMTKLIVYYVSDCQDRYNDIIRRDPSQAVFAVGWGNRTQSLLELIWA